VYYLELGNRRKTSLASLEAFTNKPSKTSWPPTHLDAHVGTDLMLHGMVDSKYTIKHTTRPPLAGRKQGTGNFNLSWARKVRMLVCFRLGLGGTARQKEITNSVHAASFPGLT
jgi:hypothetical protein